MFAEVSATIASVKALGELIGKMKDSTESRHMGAAFREAQNQLISLQSAIMLARESEAAAKERVQSLEAKIAEMQKWDVDAKRYHLHTLAPGFLVYALKPGMEDGEPPHFLCANCFNKRQKSLIQQDYSPIGKKYVCHACSADVKVSGR